MENNIGPGTIVNVTLISFLIPTIKDIVSTKTLTCQLPNRPYKWLMTGTDITIANEPIDYDTYNLPSATDTNKKAIDQFIKNIKSVINHEVAYKNFSVSYYLLPDQLKFYDEIKAILTHYKYDVTLNGQYIEIEW